MNTLSPSKVNIYISSNKPTQTSPATVLISGTSQYLIKNNLLSEFKTDSEKAIARRNLGIVFNQDPDLFILDIGGFRSQEEAWKYCSARSVILNFKIKIISYIVNDVTYFINQEHYQLDNQILLVYLFRQDRDRTYFREIVVSTTTLKVNDWEIVGYEEVLDTKDGTIVQLRENGKFNYPITLTDAVYQVKGDKKLNLNDVLVEQDSKFELSFSDFKDIVNISKDKMLQDSEVIMNIFNELLEYADDGTSNILKILANKAAISKILKDLDTNFIRTVNVTQDFWDDMLDRPEVLKLFLITFRGFNVQVYEDTDIEIPDIEIPTGDSGEIENNTFTISTDYVIENHTILDFNFIIENNTIFIE